MKLPENFESSEQTAKKSSISGLIIFLLFVLLLILLGGLYYWATFLNQPAISEPSSDTVTSEQDQIPTSTTADTGVRSDNLDTVRTSNELDAIAADVENTNLNDLDAELDAIDVELEAALEAQ